MAWVGPKGAGWLRVLPVGLAALLLAGCSLSTPGSSAASPSSTARGATGSQAASLQQAYIQVVKEVSPSVVQITTPSGLGSGVVFDDQGDIVTNAHVVGTATSFKVVTSEGKQYDGALVGSFPPDDLAVIKVGARLPPATFADSSKVQVGEIVLAMGSPLGLQGTVTEGIVSAVGREVQESPTVTLPDAIQTSAAINPGNSGGALVDLQGRVVGIPTLAATTATQAGSSLAPGIGFAISSNLAKDIAGQIVEHGHVVNSHRAFLGVVVAGTGNGVFVESVEPGGPAAVAGIQAGDLIVSVNGQPTPDTATLAQVLARLSPGQAVKVEVVRPSGSRQTLTVTLGQLPGSG